MTLNLETSPLPELNTRRLLLRALNREDAPAIFQYAQNPNVSRYTLWEPHQKLNDALAYIENYAFSYYAKGMPEPFGITLKNNPSRVIGTVGCFWVSKEHKCMELAYAIGEEFWGQGLVAEASLKVMEYCFENFDLKRLQCRCKIENLASARVMEKIGMSFEGTLRSSLYHRGRFWDMHSYAMIKN